VIDSLTPGRGGGGQNLRGGPRRAAGTPVPACSTMCSGKNQVTTGQILSQRFLAGATLCQMPKRDFSPNSGIGPHSGIASGEKVSLFVAGKLVCKKSPPNVGGQTGASSNGGLDRPGPLTLRPRPRNEPAFFRIFSAVSSRPFVILFVSHMFHRVYTVISRMQKILAEKNNRQAKLALTRFTYAN